MKSIRKMAITLMSLATVLTFSACLDDDDSTNETSYSTVVTVRKTSDKLVLQLGNNTRLTATNYSKSPYDKEVRALAILKNIDTVNGTAYVSYLDSITTKSTAINYAEKNDSAYGNDPVEIVNGTETTAMDGYLTLRFRTYWSGKKNHLVNLVHRTDANTPYLLDFQHNAQGDTKTQVGDGIVAFRLPEAFNVGNDTISITLRWKSFQKQTSGDSIKTATFKYFPRKD